MTEQYSLPARLKAARKAAGYKTSKAFIKAHKIPPSTYSQHETGRRTPDAKTLLAYSKLFGVNFEWLSTGEGEPYTHRKRAAKKKGILSGEMLDLTHPSSKKTAPQEINEKLLSEILKQIMKIKGLSNEAVANAVAGIYSDIISIEKSEDLQIHMVKTAVLAFKRYFTK